MDKILVEVYLPATNDSFDIYIPIKSKLHEIMYLLAGAFAEIYHGYFIASDKTVICDRNTGTQLDINTSAEELGLCNGAKLMLI